MRTPRERLSMSPSWQTDQGEPRRPLRTTTEITEASGLKGRDSLSSFSAAGAARLSCTHCRASGLIKKEHVAEWARCKSTTCEYLQ